MRQNCPLWREPRSSQPTSNPQMRFGGEFSGPYCRISPNNKNGVQLRASMCFKPAKSQTKVTYRQTNQTTRFSRASPSSAFSQKIGVKKQPIWPSTVHMNMLDTDDSTRIITLQIRRLRGISTQMKRFSHFTFLIEILGRCVSCSDQFSNLPGFQFALEDCEPCNGSARPTVNCVFYDFDGITPTVQAGYIYRCVGRYHAGHKIFQCFTIEQCDDDLMRLVETFQFHSDRELSKVIQAKNSSTESAVGKRAVLKVSYTGLTGSYAPKISSRNIASVAVHDQYAQYNFS
ncbi:hypothetical protein T265_09284 [Opisthorchis viverrini]|uniref:Uncharacterized protein n=1 Tax=Opisthorchis viverrini TaxID=6198 RepID=A0A074Z6B2_OPIVI|nr:hypothetical protein T265_09284 [Opisthorchis viverrini]KER22661.1 hypothetical protein T265_09284 [Opisthorchis viverrini]